MQLRAPAKLNLFLEILGKRPDGYHEIQTVMHEIELCDTIRLRERKRDISLKCAGLSAPEGPENLVWRAAEVFFRETGIKGGVRIELTKRIPSERGLGGGSSDAATVLSGMDRLFGTGLPDERLMGMAAQLGSDVPFFITGGTALCEGRGERVTPIECNRGFSFVLVIPPFGLRTALVYGELRRNDLTPRRAGAKIPLKAVKGGDWVALGAGLYNRLEGPSFRLCPELQSIKQKMAGLGFEGVLMSGSGSAVFGLACDKPAAESLAGSLDCACGVRAFAVQSFRGGDRD